jgi:hypothetical protein
MPPHSDGGLGAARRGGRCQGSTKSGTSFRAGLGKIGRGIPTDIAAYRSGFIRRISISGGKGCYRQEFRRAVLAQFTDKGTSACCGGASREESARFSLATSGPRLPSTLPCRQINQHRIHSKDASTKAPSGLPARYRVERERHIQPLRKMVYQCLVPGEATSKSRARGCSMRRHTYFAQFCAGLILVFAAYSAERYRA